jgi:NADPH:quinone reductase-like Zn-dependent oxidoreductase
MKAILFYQHGDLGQVKYADVPRPEIGPNEVLMKVEAAALNQLDLWVLKGWPSLQLKFPHIMGADGAGIVTEVGDQVAGFEVGDPVTVNPTRSCGRCQYCLSGRDNMCESFALFGEHVDGFFAEYAAVPARNLLKIPGAPADSGTFEASAAASLVYVTVWQSLIVRGALQAGESVLVVGAGGGVNTAAIQVSRLAGASPIYVIGSAEEKLALARELGADVTINRLQEDWGKAVYKATDRQGVDVVVDNVGAATYPTSLRSLRKGGRLLTVGNTSGARIEVDNRYIFGKHLTIIGSTMGTIADYEKVMGLVFSGRLRPVVDTVYPLSEGKTALERLSEGRVSGKLVLRP